MSDFSAWQRISPSSGAAISSSQTATFCFSGKTMYFDFKGFMLLLNGAEFNMDVNYMRDCGHFVSCGGKIAEFNGSQRDERKDYAHCSFDGRRRCSRSQSGN